MIVRRRESNVGEVGLFFQRGHEVHRARGVHPHPHRGAGLGEGTLHHRLGHRAQDALDGNALLLRTSGPGLELATDEARRGVRSGDRSADARRARRRARAREGPIHVVARDEPVASGTRQRLDIDAVLLGVEADGRRATQRHRRRRHRRTGRDHSGGDCSWCGRWCRRWTTLSSVLARDDGVLVGDAVTDEHGLASFADRALGLVRHLGCRSRRAGRLGRGSATTGTTDLERDEGLVHFQDVADGAVQRHDGTGVGTGQFDGRLSGLDIDQWLVEDYDVADLDLPGHDLGLGQSFTDVR